MTRSVIVKTQMSAPGTGDKKCETHMNTSGTGDKNVVVNRQMNA